MYDALLRTDVSGVRLADFHPPFPAIEIRFPTRCFTEYPVILFTAAHVAEMPNGWMDKVHKLERLFSRGETPSDAAWLQAIFQSEKELKDPVDGVAWGCGRGFGWKDGCDVSFGRVHDMSTKSQQSDGDIAWKAEELRHIQVAFCVCLLATHAHDELFSPLLLRRDDDRVLTGEALTRAVERAERLNDRKVWICGTHVLPCPSSRPETAAEGAPTGRELKAQHIRCGHFHRVRHGVGRAQTKLLWYRPMIVRPDLPPVARQRIYQTK
jgi:hypothetical protein